MLLTAIECSHFNFSDDHTTDDLEQDEMFEVG